MRAIKEHLTQHSPSSKIEYTEAKYPLLQDPSVPAFLSALYAIGVGCDVLPDGITGITPLAITKQIKKIQEEDGVSSNNYTEIYNRLIEFYLKKDRTKKMTKEYILTYCQAFLCQPAVEMASKNNADSWKYVFFPICYSTSIFEDVCTSRQWYYNRGRRS